MSRFVDRSSWGILAILRGTVVALCLLGGLADCLPSVGPSLRPIDPVEPTELQWARVMPALIAQADGVTVATITKIEEDWTYDRHCGLIAAILHQCDAPTTEKITLDGNRNLWTWTQGDFGLHVGERAVFVWTYVWATETFQCEERAGMTSQTCPTDKLPALTSDLDVLPVADSARVDSLRHR